MQIFSQAQRRCNAIQTPLGGDTAQGTFQKTPQTFMPDLVVEVSQLTHYEYYIS